MDIYLRCKLLFLNSFNGRQMWVIDIMAGVWHIVYVKLGLVWNSILLVGRHVIWQD